MSLTERFFLPVGDNRWLVKDMLKLGLLLNDVPAFHENLFEIRCGRIVGVVFNRFLSVTNGKISFVLFCC